MQMKAHFILLVFIYLRFNCVSATNDTDKPIFFHSETSAFRTVAKPKIPSAPATDEQQLPVVASAATEAESTHRIDLDLNLKPVNEDAEDAEEETQNQQERHSPPSSHIQQHFQVEHAPFAPGNRHFDLNLLASEDDDESVSLDADPMDIQQPENKQLDKGKRPVNEDDSEDIQILEVPNKVTGHEKTKHKYPLGVNKTTSFKQSNHEIVKNKKQDLQKLLERHEYAELANNVDLLMAQLYPNQANGSVDPTHGNLDVVEKIKMLLRKSLSDLGYQNAGRITFSNGFTEAETREISSYIWVQSQMQVDKQTNQFQIASLRKTVDNLLRNEFGESVFNKYFEMKEKPEKPFNKMRMYYKELCIHLDRFLSKQTDSASRADRNNLKAWLQALITKLLRQSARNY